MALPPPAWAAVYPPPGEHARNAPTGSQAPPQHPQRRHICGYSTDGDSATVKLETGSSTSTTVVNKQTGALPETGGMGTTMIYGVGAVMVAGAAVFYVTNKRTRKD